MRDHYAGLRRGISIHALRVEGDARLIASMTIHLMISIHALRVEGDQLRDGGQDSHRNFYPRPPGGGRPLNGLLRLVRAWYFYPRPPGGGRQK